MNVKLYGSLAGIILAGSVGLLGIWVAERPYVSKRPLHPELKATFEALQVDHFITEWSPQSAEAQVVGSEWNPLPLDIKRKYVRAISEQRQRETGLEDVTVVDDRTGAVLAKWERGKAIVAP